MSVQDYMKEYRFGVPKANLLGGGKKFTAKDNFPDLSKHNNVMASHLNYEVSDKFHIYYFPFLIQVGWTLKVHI